MHDKKQLVNSENGTDFLKVLSIIIFERNIFFSPRQHLYDNAV